jgi:tetratricopeptide (TPR) repeat protein
VSAALVAAFAGDDALRDRALDAIPDSTWPGAYGAFSGAATALEARRSAEAVSLLREGDAEAAAELLRRSLMEPSHDAVSVYLMGEAQAAQGNWDEALRYWEVLLRSKFRVHVRLGMGRAYEAKGDTAAALESYQGFLTMWREADQSLAPVVEAREAVARLGG